MLFRRSAASLSFVCALHLAAFLAFAGSSELAHANTPSRKDATSRARTHFKAGQALYDLGNYTDAIREFTLGYQLVSRPQFLVNLGQCHRRLDDPWKAKEFYEQFLRDAPTDAPERSQVLAIVEELEREIKVRPAPVKPPTEEPTPEKSPPTPIESNVTTTRVEIRKEWVRPSPRLKWAAVGLGVVALAFGGTGGAMLGLASAASRTVESAGSNNLPWDASVQRSDRNGRLYDIVGISLIAVGGAAAVGAIATLIAWTRPGKLVERRVEIAPSVSSQFVGAQVGGRF